MGTSKTVAGGKFLSEEAKKEQAKEQKVAAFNKWRGHILTLAGLILADGLLIYMIIAGKIDTPFGALFIAAVSMTCGYCMK